MTRRFYFAWIDENEAFNPAVHNRWDENVFDFTFDHSEGDFAGMEIIVKNPRIGLLNASRKKWVWFSFDNNGDIIPFFKGRLAALPTNIFDTLVTLDFTAKPSNYVAQKVALAATMKVLPYWDPIMVSPDSWADPDAVLEAYSKLWHIDPVTHVVTASDVIIPEDGTEEVSTSQHFYDNMQVTMNATPLRRVSIVATIPWTQSDQGNMALTPVIYQLFGQQLPSSFTMGGLVTSWPKPGANFGSGWQVLDGEMKDVSYGMPTMEIPDIFSWQGDAPNIPIGSIIFPLKTTGEFHTGETAGFNFQFELVVAAIGYGVPLLNVTYTAGREFAQVVSFTLETDQQDIVTDPGEDESMTLSLNANKVSDPTEDGSIPLGDVRRREYVHTERGIKTVEHLLLVARANLIMRSRCVETTVQMPFVDALRLKSLRKGGLFHDPRLPGGEAEGKIIHTMFKLSGDDGQPYAEITIASTVGYGGSHVTAPGTPTYVDNTLDDTQEYSGTIVLTNTADIAWTIPDPAYFDDGLDFIRGLTPGNAILVAGIINKPSEQAGPVGASGGDQAQVSSVLQTIPTKITMQMIPMEGGPFQQEVVVSVSDLIVPKQINLEAPSNA